MAGYHHLQTPERSQNKYLNKQGPLPDALSAQFFSNLSLDRLPPCLSCRKLKVQCDQGLHACHNCVQVGRTCSRTQPGLVGQHNQPTSPSALQHTSQELCEDTKDSTATISIPGSTESCYERTEATKTKRVVLGSKTGTINVACKRCHALSFNCLFKFGSTECASCQRSGTPCVYRTSRFAEGTTVASKDGMKITSPAFLAVRAIYNYNENDPSTVKFRHGELIQVLEVTASGWWYGSLDYREGWFPSTYCRIDSWKGLNPALLPGLSMPAREDPEPQPDFVEEMAGSKDSTGDSLDADAVYADDNVDNDSDTGSDIDEGLSDLVQLEVSESLQQQVLAVTKTGIIPELFPYPFNQHVIYRSSAADAPDASQHGQSVQSSGATRISSMDTQLEASGPGPRPEKRGRETDSTGATEDSDQAVAGKKACLTEDKEPVRKLACHFHKADHDKFRDHSDNGRKYKTCPNGYHTIKDLKDHLKRIHTLKNVCLRCLHDFSSSAALTSHVRQSVPCDVRQDPAFTREFIVSDSRRRVFQKKSPKTSSEAHWYLMWNVLFPGREKPASPYQIMTLEERWAQAAIDAMPAAVRMIRARIPELDMSDNSAQQMIMRSFEILRGQLFDTDRDHYLNPERMADVHDHLNTQTTTESALGIGSEMREGDAVGELGTLAENPESVVDVGNPESLDDWTYLVEDMYGPDTSFAVPMGYFAIDPQQAIQGPADLSSQNTSDGDGYVCI